MNADGVELNLPSFHLLIRFSDVGDAVLVSGALRDRPLADLVLEEGRTLITLEADTPKMVGTDKALDGLTVAADVGSDVERRECGYVRPQ